MGKPRKKDLPDLSHLCVPGAEIAVRATPKAARNAILQADGGLKISVTAAPENGKATEAVRRLLAAAMGTGFSFSVTSTMRSAVSLEAKQICCPR